MRQYIKSNEHVYVYRHKSKNIEIFPFLIENYN